jgi:hypothetical protein
MRDFRGPWGFAGGWAIDLFLGVETRPHADVDIAILRDDQAALHRVLAGARIEKVIDHTLVAWSPDETLALPIHEIHASWPDGLHLEFLLNERRGGEWAFRRDERVRLPIERAFLSRDAMPFLTPEIALLYKSKGTAAKDDGDFHQALPHLGDERRAWLRDALARTMPDHHWVAALAESAAAPVDFQLT